MSTWTTQTTCNGTPEDVLELLREPGAIARWSPVPFRVPGADRERLSAGDRVRVRGELAGRGLEFLVDVAEADDGHLALTATGPIRIDVDYRVVGGACGSSLRARIGVASRPAQPRAHGGDPRRGRLALTAGPVPSMEKPRWMPSTARSAWPRARSGCPRPATGITPRSQ